MFEFLTNAFESAPPVAQAANVVAPVASATTPANPGRLADSAAPGDDPTGLGKLISFQSQMTNEIYNGEGWFGPDKDKVQALLANGTSAADGQISLLEEMRTRSPEMYRGMRASILQSLEGADRDKALAQLPEASIDDINREKLSRMDSEEDREKFRALNEDVKKISPERRKELEEAVTKVKGSQGLMSNDMGAVREALQGKSPAEIEAMKRLWLDKYPGSVLDMEQFITSHHNSGGDGIEAQALLSGDQTAATAATLYNSLSGLNDNKTALAALEKITDPKEREKVAAEFKNLWEAKLLADDPAAVPSTDDPLKFLETTVVAETDGVLLHDKDADIAKHLIHGDAGKAAAVKLDEGAGIFNDSEEEMYAALDGMKDPAMRAQMEEELKARGTSLKEKLEHLDGAEKEIAEAKLEGDKTKEAAARAKVATDGLGTDKAALFKTMEGKSLKEREAIVAQYNKMYGKSDANPDGQDWSEMMTDELSDKDVGRIIHLDEKGQLDPKFALYYATDGAGTNDAMAKDALKRMDPKDRDALMKDKTFMKDMFNLSDEEFAKVQENPSGLPMLLMKERNLLDSLDVQEVSGREGFEMAQLLLGADYDHDGKVDEKDTIAKVKDSQEFSRGAGAGVLAAAADAVSVNDSEVNQDLNYSRVLEMGKKLEAGGLNENEKKRLQTLAGYHDSDLKMTLEQRDQFGEMAAGGAAATAALISMIFTAGGSAALIAAVSAGASGAGGLATKALIQGDHLSNETVATDIAMAAAQAASGGLLATDKAGAIFAKLGENAAKMMQSPAGKKALEMLATEAAKGASQALAPALVSALTNSELWTGDGDGGSLVAGILMTQLAAGAASNVATAGVKGAIDNQKLAAFLGGASSATISELINNNEGIAKAVREGRMTPEVMSSIINIVQSAADNMGEDAEQKGKPHGAGADDAPAATHAAAPAHDSDAPAATHPQATPEPQHAPVHAPDEAQPQHRAAEPAADKVPEGTVRYGEEQQAAAKRGDWDKAFSDGYATPEELRQLEEWRNRQSAGDDAPASHAEPAAATHGAEEQPKAARPFEDQFNDRLDGEGHWSDDPDPQGLLKKGDEPATRAAPDEDVGARAKPDAGDEEVAPVAKPDEDVGPQPKASAADKAEEKPVGARIDDRMAELEARTQGGDDAHAEREKALLSEVKGIEDPALAEAVLKVAGRESADETGAEQLRELVARAAEGPEGAHELKDALARLEVARAQEIRTADPEAVASAQRKLASGEALSPAEQTALLRQSVDAARKGLVAEMHEMGVSADVALNPEQLGGNCGWAQGRVANSLEGMFGADSGAKVARHATHGDADVGKQSKLTGDSNHFFTVVQMPDGQSYIVDPTFGQFMQANPEAGKVGTRLMNSEGGADVAKALVQDGFVPLTPEVAQAYGAAMTGKPGEYSVGDFLEGNATQDNRGRAARADDKLAAKGHMAAADEAYNGMAVHEPAPRSPLASAADADSAPYVSGLEKSLKTTPAGEKALAALGGDDSKVTITTERGKGNFRDGDHINIDPDASGDSMRKMAGVLVEQMAVNPDLGSSGGSPEDIMAAAKRNAAEARAERIEHHLDEGHGPDRDLKGAREYDTAVNEALARGASADDARAAGVAALEGVLTDHDVAAINPSVADLVPPEADPVYASSASQAERLKADLASQELAEADRRGSGLKDDAEHRAASYVDPADIAQNGKVFPSKGYDGVTKTLVQSVGEVDGRPGIFEYLLAPDGTVVHQRFIPDGIVNGAANQTQKERDASLVYNQPDFDNDIDPKFMPQDEPAPAVEKKKNKKKDKAAKKDDAAEKAGQEKLADTAEKAAEAVAEAPAALQAPQAEAAPAAKARAFDDLSSPDAKKAFTGPGPERQAPDPAEVSRLVAKAKAGGEPLTADEAATLMAQVAYGARVAMWGQHLKLGGDVQKNIYSPEHLGGWSGQAQAAAAMYASSLIPGAQVHPLQAAQTFGADAPAHAMLVVEMPGGQKFIVDPTVAQFYDPNATGKDQAGAVGMRTPGDGQGTMDTLKEKGYLPLNDDTARIYGQTIGGAEGLTPSDFVPGPDGKVRPMELDYTWDKMGPLLPQTNFGQW